MGGPARPQSAGSTPRGDVKRASASGRGELFRELSTPLQPGDPPFRKSVHALGLIDFFADFHGSPTWFDTLRLKNVSFSPDMVQAVVDRLHEQAQSGRISTHEASLRLDKIWLSMLLRAHHPIQIPLDSRRLASLMWWVARDGLKGLALQGCMFELNRAGRLSVVVPRTRMELAAHRGTLSKEVLRGIFPRKSHPLAGKKANLFLDKVLSDLEMLCPHGFKQVKAFSQYVQPGVVTDDQMCSAIVYAWSMADQVAFGTAFSFGIFSVTRPVESKQLSDLLKATGCTECRLGCCMVESNTLLGRGVGRVDLVADARLRCGDRTHPRLFRPDHTLLKTAINYILDMELGGKDIVLPSSEQFWYERFRWCVGGNHSRAANAHWDRKIDYKPPGGRRLTRRICAELQHECPFEGWDGTVGVSLAEKIEHAKSRAIYSCDTLSYFAFSWLLGPVEKAWNSKRVILDPGKDGSLGMFGRISRLYQSSNLRCFAMADYADFNSQHTLEAQKMLFEQLAARIQTNETDLVNKLVRSFDSMDCYYQGWYLGRINSTLMSGHRATTFINSVLNAAYCIMAWGIDTYESIASYHVGDDVIVLVPSPRTGWLLIEALATLGCEMQPSKQSVGTRVFEFLRMAGHPERGARGYLCRAIAGLSSGNWVTDQIMEPREGLFSLVNQARSLINRSGNPHAFKIIIESSMRITGVPRGILHEFLSGLVAIAPGPCYRQDGKYCFRRIEEYIQYDSYKSDKKVVYRQPLNATHDYVDKGLHPVERMAINYCGFAPTNAMAIASYGLSRPSVSSGRDDDVVGRPRLVIGPQETTWRRGCIHTSSITTTEVRHGILACYPVAQLLKKRIPVGGVRNMLAYLGVFPAPGTELEVAWGSDYEGTVFFGTLPYSDAAGITARYKEGTVIVDKPIFM